MKGVVMNKVSKIYVSEETSVAQCGFVVYITWNNANGTQSITRTELGWDMVENLAWANGLELAF